MVIPCEFNQQFQMNQLDESHWLHNQNVSILNPFSRYINNKKMSQHNVSNTSHEYEHYWCQGTQTIIWLSLQWPSPGL